MNWFHFIFFYLDFSRNRNEGLKFVKLGVCIEESSIVSK